MRITEEQDILEINKLMLDHKIHHDIETFTPSIKKSDKLTHIRGSYMDMNGYRDEVIFALDDSFLNCDKMECVFTDRLACGLADGYIKIEE